MREGETSELYRISRANIIIITRVTGRCMPGFVHVEDACVVQVEQILYGHVLYVYTIYHIIWVCICGPRFLVCDFLIGYTYALYCM